MPYKAKKQIKDMYANMKPEHRIRHRIGMLEGASIKNHVHRQIVKLARGMLKKEELHGNGYWDDAWESFKYGFKLPFNFLADVPLLKEGLALAFPEVAPLIAAAPDVMKLLFGEDTPATSADTADVVSLPSGPVAVGEKYNRFTGEYVKSTPGWQYTAKLDKMLEHVQEEVEPSITPTNPPYQRDIYGRVMGLDEAIRFPMTYNYDENSRPQYLQDFLLSQSVAGKNFTIKEFGNTYQNQKPYEFLDFPMNGGKIKKLSFSKVGY